MFRSRSDRGSRILLALAEPCDVREVARDRCSASCGIAATGSERSCVFTYHNSLSAVRALQRVPNPVLEFGS
ncbi:hypothetical protein GCM10010530_58690 [Kribbella aluminosa]